MAPELGQKQFSMGDFKITSTERLTTLGYLDGVTRFDRVIYNSGVQPNYKYLYSSC